MSSSPVATGDLATWARSYHIDPHFALGLGAGLYFEYLNRADHSPTRHIHGLNRNLGPVLPDRIERYHREPEVTLRAALIENALAFNVDRAPMIGILGMETLAEDLVEFDKLPDGMSCLEAMSDEIAKNNALHRSTYLCFLESVSDRIPVGAGVKSDLILIIAEWRELGDRLGQASRTGGGGSLEAVSLQLRRIAFREERFWGHILDSTRD